MDSNGFLEQHAEIILLFTFIIAAADKGGSDKSIMVYCTNAHALVDLIWNRYFKPLSTIHETCKLPVVQIHSEVSDAEALSYLFMRRVWAYKTNRDVVWCVCCKKTVPGSFYCIFLTVLCDATLAFVHKHTVVLQAVECTKSTWRELHFCW